MAYLPAKEIVIDDVKVDDGTKTLLNGLYERLAAVEAECSDLKYQVIPELKTEVAALRDEVAQLKKAIE